MCPGDLRPAHAFVAPRCRDTVVLPRDTSLGTSTGWPRHSPTPACRDGPDRRRASESAGPPRAMVGRLCKDRALFQPIRWWLAGALERRADPQAVELLRPLGQNLASGQRRAPGLARIGHLEEAHEEIRHLRGSRRLLTGEVTRARDTTRLHGHDAREHHQQQDEPPSDGDARVVAADKLADAVRRARWTGEDGDIVEMTTQVRRQIRHGAVTARAVLLERLHRDPIEIASQLASQPRGVAVGRQPRGGGRSRGHPVLGRGGSTSRIVWRSLSRPCSRSAFDSNGNVPVSSS